MGEWHDGLILREQWIARPGLLERLAERFRARGLHRAAASEAELTLNRFARG